MYSNYAQDVGAATEGLMAAIDLGSNSFHMLVAEMINGRLVEVLRCGEKIQLAAGLNDDLLLTDNAMRRGYKCLEHFAQKLTDIPVERISIVGTDALRCAANSMEFVRTAESLLGVPVQVISGDQEAKLIYRGVLSGACRPDIASLVFDIGGGSTELALGQGRLSKVHASLPLGCIHYSRKYFSQQRTDRKHFEQVVSTILQTLTLLPVDFQTGNWQQVVGASGSVLAIESVLIGLGWSEKGINRSGLDRLVDYLCNGENFLNLPLMKLPADRADIFLGGLAILYALFEELGLQQIETSRQALREGLIYSMLDERQALSA